MEQAIVITGVGGGPGSVFATKPAKDGKLIAVLDYDMKAVQRVTARIREQGGTAAAVRCNVVGKNSMEQARRKTREKLGRYNVLINCTGIQDPLVKTTVETYRQGEEMDMRVSKADPGSPDSRGAARELLGRNRTLLNIDVEKMMEVINVSWLRTVIASQVFTVDLVGMKGDSIINITSMAAYGALSMMPVYASSKVVVDMFTRWLPSYPSNEPGKVGVDAVAPEYFLALLNHDTYVNPNGTYTQRYYNMIHHAPMGKLGDFRELMGALRFFADPGASGYVIGQVTVVDGGFLSCPGI